MIFCINWSLKFHYLFLLYQLKSRALHGFIVILYNIYIYIYLFEKSNKINNYCGDAGPNWYTGPRALFDDMDMSEEKSMIGKAPDERIT